MDRDFTGGGETEGFDATVAVCSYNGAERIPRVFDSLQAQRDGGVRWEILVVDNASTDETNSVAGRLAAASRVPMRVVRESRPALSFARRCAGRHARGEIVCFLDDDTPADADYVRQAVLAFRRYPRAGSLGGKVVPEWASAPTELALRVCNFALAVCDHGEKAFRYEGVEGGPVGAGMCVRRDALLEAYRDDAWAAGNPGPIGERRISGSELALHAVLRSKGYELWYVPELVVTHVIPERRMRFDSLLELYESIGRGQASVRRIRDCKARNPVTATLIAAKDLARWLAGAVRGPRHGGSTEDAGLARELHELRQRQVLGRALQALPWRR